MTCLRVSDFKELRGVHPVLAATVVLAGVAFAEHGNGYVFRVVDGMRSLDQQQANVKAGVSKTLKSAHLVGLGVDLAILSPDRKKFITSRAIYAQLHTVMKASAVYTGAASGLVWGGNWTAFRDSMHWQLDGFDYV